MTRAQRLTLAKLMDRERRTLELQGLRAAGTLGSQARVYAIRTWEATQDPAQTADAARRLLERKAVPVLREVMLNGHLLGRLRTIRTAERHPRFDRRALAFATTYENARKALLRRLDLTDDELISLRNQYNAAAVQATTQVATALEQKVQQRILQALEEGAGVRDGVKLLRIAFEEAGVTAAADYQLESIFRTQTQASYGAGRWNSLQDPAVQDILWGFEYASTRDDRVRPEHEGWDGTRLPKNHAWWQTHWPPNGYNCRCTAIEIFDNAVATDVPDGDADPGFSVNYGQVYRDLLRAA